MLYVPTPTVCPIVPLRVPVVFEKVSPETEPGPYQRLQHLAARIEHIAPGSPVSLYAVLQEIQADYARAVDAAGDNPAKARERLGFVPNVFRVYAFRPERLSAWFAHFRQLHEPSEHLSVADREMIAVVVSAAVESVGVAPDAAGVPRVRTSSSTIIMPSTTIAPRITGI